MKSMIRVTSLLVFLLVTASPLFAQAPKIAIQFNVDQNCVKGNLANITTATINVKYVELWIYDQKTCKRICLKRKVLNTRIKSCDKIAFDICCDTRPPADPYIYYVRVTHSGGVNEQWNIS
jgi:hypothetical protein